MKISFTCIGHNERTHLGELLPDLLKWGDEVIYVDCESQDLSYEYATEVGCRTFRQENNRNLNVNKTFAMEQATGDWIFYVDPDERFDESLVQEVRQKISQGHHQAFKLNRRNHFFGQWLKHGGQYPDTQLRVFKKGAGHFANEHVHESLKIQGSIGRLTMPMDHHPYLTLSQLIKKFDFYSTFEAEHLYKKGVRTGGMNHVKFLLFKPCSRFFRRYLVKGGIRDGIPGYVAALFDALGWMTRYLKLWEIQKNNSPK